MLKKVQIYDGRVQKFQVETGKEDETSRKVEVEIQVWLRKFL